MNLGFLKTLANLVNLDMLESLESPKNQVLLASQEKAESLASQAKAGTLANQVTQKILGNQGTMGMVSQIWPREMKYQRKRKVDCVQMTRLPMHNIQIAG